MRRLRSRSGCIAWVLWLCVTACGDDDAGGPDLQDPSASAGAGHVEHGHSGDGQTHSEEGLPAGSPGSSHVLIKPTSDEPASGDGTGAFRTTCEFSHMRYDDPIVFPGVKGASHLHTFFGNTQTDAFSTADSLRNSGNSTCRGGIANRSSYWVPALLDESGEPIAPETANIYYKSGYHGVDAEDIRPFPEGLRMIGGDAAASSDQDVSWWTCGGGPHSGSIPDCDSGEQLLMHVEFPQCWNGQDTDSDNHKRHMAYPVDGACPASHPVAIPAISYNIPYTVPSRGTRGWRLASDSYPTSQPGGYSAHGDWFEGWDPKIVEVFVKDCINPGVDCHSHLLGDGREIYFTED